MLLAAFGLLLLMEAAFLINDYVDSDESLHNSLLSSDDRPTVEVLDNFYYEGFDVTRTLPSPKLQSDCGFSETFTFTPTIRIVLLKNGGRSVKKISGTLVSAAPSG